MGFEVGSEGVGGSCFGLIRRGPEPDVRCLATPVPGLGEAGGLS